MLNKVQLIGVQQETRRCGSSQRKGTRDRGALPVIVAPVGTTRPANGARRLDSFITLGKLGEVCHRYLSKGKLVR